MPYDDVLLTRLSLRALHATGKPLYQRTAEETLDYVSREMSSPKGGVFSAQDAEREHP